MTDYTELKRLAEAATPGPWYQHGGIMQVLNDGCETVCETFENDGDCPDAQFIAAANPTAVMALISDLDEARNGMKYSCAIRLKNEIERLEAERDQLKAENEALLLERGGKVLCDMELFETLRDSANTEADEHRQCMATYRPLRQANLDSVVKKCDDLLAAMGKGEQS